MMPDLRIRFPNSSRPSTAAIRPGWKLSELAQGLRGPVTSTNAVGLDVEVRSGWQRQQIDAPRGDVLADVARCDLVKSGGAQLGVKPGEQADALYVRLAEGVRGAAAYRGHHAHRQGSPFAVPH